MILLRNQKGIVLITTYMVALILAVLSAAFYMRGFQEKMLRRRQSDSLKAFYNAEKALSYAYFESAKADWAWFTHRWDTSQAPQRAVSNNLTSADALRTQGLNADCHFITSGPDQGCYAANDGSFILKTFANPRSSKMTMVRAKGISGNIERVIENCISYDPIYDFYVWTPYDLTLDNVGGDQQTGSEIYVNGGRIHANGNIVMSWRWKKFCDVDTISTGKDKGISCYNWKYIPPGIYDCKIDSSGETLDGKAPVPHLGNPSPRRWAGTTEAQPYGTQYPWKYEQLPGVWSWRPLYVWYGAEVYAGADSWPPRDWRNTDNFFYTYGSWIYPAQKDENGNPIFDADGNLIRQPGQQIPAKLNNAFWDWEKYWNYNTIGGNPQQPISFVVYDPATGGTKPVEDTRWKIITNPDNSQSVIMTALSDPGGITYWEMLQRPEYWAAIGIGAGDWSASLNPEVLDGTYGSDFAGRTIPVDNLNSIKQSEAWNAYLQQSGMDAVFLTNEHGEDIDPPRFGSTYKEKSKKAGLYLSISGGTYTLHYGNGTSVEYTAQTCGPCGNSACSGSWTNTANNDNWLVCLEPAIDVLVNRLNTAPDGSALPEEQKAARKVKFVNTYTTRQNVVLEIDIGKMRNAGTFPANEIVYSEVPIRLANANQLPYLGEDASGDTFNVISEQNIYLKGDYNNPASDNFWMTSAIVSKKHIYTLSNDFNDPQVPPAPVHYPNFYHELSRSCVYVTEDAGHNLIEADPAAGGGTWVNAEEYPEGSLQSQQALNLATAMEADWQAAFDKNDPSGSNTYTVSSTHPWINGRTWGAMPNRVQQNHTYNCLMASYYGSPEANWASYYTQPRGGIPNGISLERWYDNLGAGRTKTLKGTYFQLDWGDEYDENRFTAHQSDGPLDGYFYSPLDPHGANWAVYYNAWVTAPPGTYTSYDSRFRNPLLHTNKSIFFGGGESSWRELPVSSF